MTITSFDAECPLVVTIADNRGVEAGLPRIVRDVEARHNGAMPHRRVLIVDDHDAFLTSARSLLIAEGFDVVSCAATGEQALSAVASLAVDLVLVDLYLPGIDGVTVAERIAALPAPPDVILISSQEDAVLEPRVAAAPVRGFLAKRELAWETIEHLLA